MQKAIVTTAYLGPVQYYTIFNKYEKVYIEQFDHYMKQTYRNRCRILAANGVLDLTIPVVKKSGSKQILKDVEIDYAMRWQKNHWRSLFSAYSSSPFFEYYEPDLVHFYEKKWRFLIDFNTELHNYIVEQIEIDCRYDLSSYFEKEFNGSDFREVLSPKKSYTTDGSGFCPEVYSQTFSEKFNFFPNMSIADLLFNRGPESGLVLDASIINV
jgi:hypothetical protein